jgi:20S proteasome alpha/beta subunit
MTTLIGIKAEKEKKGVILGSDISRTQTHWESQGDIAYRQQKRTEGQKIYIDKSGNSAICMTGVFDGTYIEFLSKFIEGEFDIEKITKTKSFPELLNLNLSRWGGRVPNDELLNALLLATRVNGPELYTCFPLGYVETRSATSIGSGSRYALEYLSGQEKLIPRGISIREGVDLTVAALDKASQDLYTGGLDLVVVTDQGIDDIGKNIRKKVDSARLRAINEAKRSLK